MAIVIQNISKYATQFGIHSYRISINNEVICEFEHRREDGLAKCLLEASKAVEQAKWEKTINFLKLLPEI